jgi:hypothetical protein
MRTVALLALLIAGLLPAVARADGDPASDVLAMQDVYYPYAPPTDPKLRKALEKVVADSRKAGYPIKLALIQSERDLGSYPELFNQANEYATLLSRELPANRHGPKLTDPRVLIVMPGGFGGIDLGDRVDEALASIEIQADAESDGLAIAAIGAVAKLATVNGHPVDTPPEASIRRGAPSASGDGGGGGPSPVVFLVPAVILFAGLFAAGRIAARRQR